MAEEYSRKITKIRNIGVMAHIDAGKTTTTERILFQSGKIHKIGEVHEGQAKMDFMDQEQERGITIQSAATTVYWNDHQINIIDTPGHVDFTAEVERSLRVLDGGIVVLDGKKGVEAQTETVWRQANKYKIPRLIFVNKMDSVDGTDKFDDCIKSIVDKFGADPIPVQFPIGYGKDFHGLVDVIEQKAYFFEPKDKNENYKTEEIPRDLIEKTLIYRKNLIEKVIEHDEEIALSYLEDRKEPTTKEIKKLLRTATLTGRQFPVFCGSAYKYVGVKLILDGVVNYLPSPEDVKEIITFDPDNSENKRVITWNDNSTSCLALAFKITVDSYNNKLTFFRVYSGKITSNSYVYNINRKKKERVSRLVRMNANDKEDIKEVCAGDIAAAVGLENTVTGDTFGDEKKPYLLEAIDFAEPVITQAIEPKTNEDRDRMRDALEKLKVQDPSFKYWIDKETGQMIIAGMGELHLEVCIERLRREYKLNIESKQQRVSYRETIKNRTENIVAEYKKQSGGSGHYAKIIVKFEPNPGKGFEFVNAVRGDGVPKNFAEATGKGIEETMFNGLLLGYPTVDVKVTLMDGKTHSVDSKELDFKEAAVIAFRGDGRSGKEERIKQMGSVLLEPIMNLEVIVPKDYMGDILANLASRRTVVESTDEKDGETYIKGKCPLKEMLSYSTTLRQLTKGRGSYSMSLSHYQEVPKDVFEEISKSEK